MRIPPSPRNPFTLTISFPVPPATLLLLRSIALAVGLSVGPASVALAAPDPPAPGPTFPPHLALVDGQTSRPRREIHDVTHVTIDAKAAALEVVVRFRRPLLVGVFECVHLYVDCDADLRTGIDGADLWVRAAFGSRYQRADAPAVVEGTGASARLFRSSWSLPHTQAMRGQKGLESWLHQLDRRVDPPTVEGAELRFQVPLDLLVARGFRYNMFVRVRVEAEGSLSESPIWLEYVCADEGTPIELDGSDAEWSGQPRVLDATEELHPDTSEVDLASLEVDHDATHVHALVRLATDGFGSYEGDGDVEDQDRVTVALEPLESGGRYMGYVEHAIVPPKESKFGVADGALVEFSIPRVPEQTAFRVVAWSDAIRIDRIPQKGWAEVGVPPEAFRPR